MSKRIGLILLFWGLINLSAQAFEPFVVKDIRVEGLQRISAGTVFNYLPIKIGSTMDNSSTASAIRTLYKTGFFRDVRDRKSVV